MERFRNLLAGGGMGMGGPTPGAVSFPCERFTLEEVHCMVAQV